MEVITAVEGYVDGGKLPPRWKRKVLGTCRDPSLRLGDKLTAQMTEAREAQD